MAARWLNQEHLARLVLLLALSLPLATLAAWEQRANQPIEIRALMPEVGGWQPGNLTAQVGEPLHLRLTSDDVVHGFAVGPGPGAHYEVKPGMITEAVLHFDRPGTYTFYCTRWCGPNHWRMRGTIEVLGDSPLAAAGPQPTPLYLSLDLDAPHPSAQIPGRTPSAALGAELAGALPDPFRRVAVYQQQSPAQLWQQLGGVPELAALSEDQRWDLVAFVWQSHARADRLEQGKRLYDQQCAACHGQHGAGDGVMAPMMTGSEAGHGLQPAADFTDPARMLGASSALLYGKIARGGMGSGMPNWGTIFSEAQIGSLVDYLWRFQFPETQPLTLD